MKDDIRNGERVRGYDHGGKTADRYTAVYLDQPYYREHDGKTFHCVSMNHEPFHPQGIGPHGAAVCGKHLGKRVPMDSLPVDCVILIDRDTGT